MKISELNVKDFLSRNTDAEANSYLILNYGENDTEPAVTQRISLKELSNMIINNNKLLQYTPDNKNLTSINYASNAYNKTPAIGQYIDTDDRSVLDSAVTAVSYDGTNKKFTRSIRGGTTGDIVSVSTLKIDMALNNVDNTSDANKPISTATQTALDNKVPITRKVNGHALSADITITKGDVSLGNVDNTADTDKPVSTATQAALNLKMNSSARGAANGVASLDENSKIPAAQLPSYVDDIIEGYYYEGSFYNEIAHTSVINGESGKIYVDLTENGPRQVYRWSGNAGYVAIPIGLALGETSSTAYAGDKGAAAYTHAVTNKGIAKTSGLYKITTNSEGHVTAATAVVKSDITGLGIPGSDTTYEMDGTYNASTNKVATVSTVTNAVSGLAPIASPAFTGSISLNRKTGTTAGTESIAVGNETAANGDQTVAFGRSTISNGDASFTCGTGLVAAGGSEFVIGTYNKLPAQAWQANTAYEMDDYVVYQDKLYYCSSPHTSAATFEEDSGWYHARKHLLTVGNGNNSSGRGNAFVVDIWGNAHLKGDLYIGCDDDSQGGNKVIAIPEPPSSDGTYTLQCTVASGVVTYNWVSST